MKKVLVLFTPSVKLIDFIELSKYLMDMKISSTQLEAFYAVARFRNFTKAAAAVSVTQSALSQRIINLEQDLQTTLFIRDRGGIELTPAAEDLLTYCQLQEKFENEFLARLQSPLHKQIAGPVRIAGYSTIMRSVILPSLANLTKDNPLVELHLQTKEMRDLLSVLKRREADFIITDEKIEREEIVSIKLGTEYNVLIESAHHTTKDVYLDHDHDDETTKKYLKLSKKSTNIGHRHFLDDVYGLIDGVKMGLGKAVIPRHLIATEKNLKIIDPTVMLKNSVYVHFYQQPFYTQAHNTVIEALKEKVPEYLK